MFVRGAFALLVLLTFTGCNARDSLLQAKIDAQAKQISDIQSSLRAIQVDLRPNGRFQVMNGTPQLARNIMLVDTQTGRVWITCETKSRESTTNVNWCATDFYGKATPPE